MRPRVLWAALLSATCILPSCAEAQESPPRGPERVEGIPTAPTKAEVQDALRKARTQRAEELDRDRRGDAELSWIDDEDPAWVAHYALQNLGARDAEERAPEETDPEVARNVLDLLQGYITGDYTTSIWNGDPVGEGLPQCVAIGEATPNGRGGWNETWCCSGVLVAHNAVLTANHCFDAVCLDRGKKEGPGTNLWVYFGPGGGEDGQVERVVKFDRFSLDRPPYLDLALLILEKDVTDLPGHDGPVEPLRFADTQTIDQAEDLLIVGFGLFTHGKGGEKRSGTVKVTYPRCDAGAIECRGIEELVAADVILDDQDDQPQDACQGDSGGPALTPDGALIIGITSRSLKDSGECGPGGIYTRVDSALFRDWITKVQGVNWGN